MIQVMKNISMMGSMLFLMANGSDALSLDNFITEQPLRPMIKTGNTLSQVCQTAIPDSKEKLVVVIVLTEKLNFVEDFIRCLTKAAIAETL